MKKIIGNLSAVILSACVMSFSAVTAFAEDAKLSFDAETTNGSWGISVKYLTNRNADVDDAIDPVSFTEDTVIKVSYESDLDDEDNHIELILQTWGDHTTSVAADWNKVEPDEVSKGYNEYTYDSLVKAYGTDDFSELYAICVGDNGSTPITVTDIEITNLDESVSENSDKTEESDEEAASEESSEETEEVKADEEESETAETTVNSESSEEALQTTEEASSSFGAGGVILIVVIVIIVAVIALILFMMKRKGKPKDNENDWRR